MLTSDTSRHRQDDEDIAYMAEVSKKTAADWIKYVSVLHSIYNVADPLPYTQTQRRHRSR